VGQVLCITIQESCIDGTENLQVIRIFRLFMTQF